MITEKLLERIPPEDIIISENDRERFVFTMKPNGEIWYYDEFISNSCEYPYDDFVNWCKYIRNSERHHHDYDNHFREGFDEFNEPL